MWLIEEDWIADSPEESWANYGMFGFNELDKIEKELGHKPSIKEVKKHMPIKFMLLDDDNNIYFVGITDNANPFEPLDDMKETCGCTSIKQFTDGKWTEI